MRVISAAGMTQDELNRVWRNALDKDEDLKIDYRPGVTDNDEWLVGPGYVVEILPAGPPISPAQPRDCSPRPAQSKITTCYLCLQPLSDPVHMDHALPKSMGGMDGLQMPVHERCNLLKSNRPLIQPAP